jgi:hypothetical protein
MSIPCIYCRNHTFPDNMVVPYRKMRPGWWHHSQGQGHAENRQKNVGGNRVDHLLDATGVGNADNAQLPEWMGGATLGRPWHPEKWAVRVRRTIQHSPTGHALVEISFMPGSTTDPAWRMTQDVWTSRPATEVPAPAETQVAPVYPAFALRSVSFQPLRYRVAG